MVTALIIVSILIILILIAILFSTTSRKSFSVTEAELKASIVAIHYHAKRLYKMLEDKQTEQKSIIYSIYKECEDRIPELKKNRKFN
jgi:hypothetical protein